jgi:hypothetical protein
MYLCACQSWFSAFISIVMGADFIGMCWGVRDKGEEVGRAIKVGNGNFAVGGEGWTRLGRTGERRRSGVKGC